MMLPRIIVAVFTTGALTTSVLSQASNPAVQPTLEGQVSQLAPDALYEGWRSQQLIGQQALRRSGDQFGIVRDLIIDADGRLAAVLIAGEGTVSTPDALFRIPWNEIDLTPGQKGVVATISEDEKARYALFPGTEGVQTLPREFRLTEVLGDYARLQAGYGYGYVTDAVFGRDGRLIAVLISRDAASGGGTFAFPFLGTVGRWDPGASYYGLPFITASQAQAAGLRVEPKGFKNSLQ